MEKIVSRAAVPRLTSSLGCNARVGTVERNAGVFKLAQCPGSPLQWHVKASTGTSCVACIKRMHAYPLRLHLAQPPPGVMRDIFSVTVVVRWMHAVGCRFSQNLLWRSVSGQEVLRSNICRLFSWTTSIDEAIHSSSGAAQAAGRHGPLTGRATGGSEWLG